MLGRFLRCIWHGPQRPPGLILGAAVILSLVGCGREVRVVDIFDQPIAGAAIETDAPSFNGKFVCTDSEGKAIVPHTWGERTLHITASGFIPLEEPVPAFPAVVMMTGMGTPRIKVVDAKGHPILALVHFAVASALGFTVTDRSGFFQVPPLRYELSMRIEAPGFQSRLLMPPLPSIVRLDRTLPVPAGGARDASTKPVPTR